MVSAGGVGEDEFFEGGVVSNIGLTGGSTRRGNSGGIAVGKIDGVLGGRSEVASGAAICGEGRGASVAVIDTGVGAWAVSAGAGVAGGGGGRRVG